MAVKMMLDPGHGGFDNGGVYYNRVEKEDNQKLAMLVGEKLEQAGVEVSYTRTFDRFLTTEERAQMANDADVDYFVSLHRNQSPYPNTYSGVETLIFNQGDIKQEFCKNINMELSEVGFDNLGCNVRRDYTVLRKTKMPALLIQVGYINSDSDNALFDEKIDEIADAIVNGILLTLNQQQEDMDNGNTNGNANGNTNGNANGNTNGNTNGNNGMTNGSGDSKYVIQLGLFRQYDNAVNLQGDLKLDGIETYLARSGEFYGVFTDDFDTFQEAIAEEERLNQLGYSTLIIETME